MHPGISGDEQPRCVTEQSGGGATEHDRGGATEHAAQEVNVHATTDAITNDLNILDKKKTTSGLGNSVHMVVGRLLCDARLV